MEEIDLTPGVKPGGKVPVAYSKDQGFPSYEGQPRAYFFRSHFDCEGRVMGGRWGASLTIKTKEGFKTIKYVGYGQPTATSVGGQAGTTDLRSLTMTAAGCCPPELMTGFLQQEDAGKDAVVEAIKLRKRGYFGGGG